jgi:RecB family exonuclease
MNFQEIESALRTCMAQCPPCAGDMPALSSLFRSLDLDEDFICKEVPFAQEAPRALDLSKHIYSASQLHTYLACPRRFYYEKILKIAPERPEDFGLGQLVHAVLERFHEKVKSFSEVPEALVDSLNTTFRVVWLGGSDGDGRDAFSSQFGTVLQRSAIEHKAMAILDRYLRTEIAQSQETEIVVCEKSVDFQIADYQFTARIDRVDRLAAAHCIIDYKTSASGPQKAATIKKQFLNIDGVDKYAPTDYQLPIYVFAARSAGFTPVELTYYWLAQEDAKGMFKRATLCVGNGGADCLSNEELRIVERDIAGVIGRIVAGDFEPRPRQSYDCRWCSFDIICSSQGEGDDEG